MEHVDHFRSHLDILSLQKHILKMVDTYMGVTLAYLKEVHFYHYGSNAAVFGIEDLADPGTRFQVSEALPQVQHIVQGRNLLVHLVHSLPPAIDTHLHQGRGTGG